MAHVFVSYARSTSAQAQLIAQRLRDAGREVWIDDQLLAHRAFADVIEEQLNKAAAVVVVWSADAVRSEWVRAEANRARRAAKLVQVRLQPCGLPMPFDQIHCVDLAGWSGDPAAAPWRSVLASVAAVIGAPGPKAEETPAAERRRERRQVTALACDLMDTGLLANRVDPEDMMQVLEVWQASCDDILGKYGGTISKATGEGVLAYFGYPRADEEEAANAVRAAIALCEAAGAQAAPAGIRLRAQVGVATGLVVVSDLADRAPGRGGGVVGATPNLAVRLQSVAAPGGVVVSEATRRITEGLFSYRDLGTQTLAGYDAPVGAFEVTGATAAESRSQARTHNASSSLFGREPELQLIQQSWAMACEGEGQVVLVQGEAGIGKSRLIEAFRRGLADTPAIQNTWYCAPNYSDSVLHPVSEQLARVAGFDRADDAEVRRGKLAALLDRYGVTGSQSHLVLGDLVGIRCAPSGGVELLTPDRRKALTLDALLMLMEQAARTQPALFVVEDLHWADPTTLELLDRATRKAADQRWLILATARPEFETRWSDDADVIHVQLSRLGHADSERICAELGAEAMLPPEVVRQIIARSDGVPLFVEEMTKAVLEATAGAQTAAGASMVAIPDTLHDSLAARLDRLGPAKQVASLAAAIGRRFSYGLLAAISPLPVTELRAALRELARAGLVERNGVPPNSQYLFRHALIRDVAYESLLKREREALHARIAAALQEHFPEILQAEPALVAHHLTEGGAIADAIPFWAEAGGRAGGQAAHVEAVSHFQTALTLLRRLPPDDGRAGLELQILLGLAGSLGASRGYSVPEVARVLADALAICDRLGNPASLFAVLYTICAFSVNASDLTAADAAMRRCRAISDESGSIEQAIVVTATMGHICAMKGAMAEALALGDQAYSQFKSASPDLQNFVGINNPIVGILTTRLLVLEAMGDSAGAHAASSELIACLPSLGRSYDSVYALCWHAAYDVMHRNYLRACEFAQQAFEICAESGYDTYQNCALALQSLARGRLKDLDGSLAAAENGIAALDRLGVKSMRAFFLSELAGLQAEAGEMKAALASVDAAIALALKFHDRFYLSPAYRIRAEVLAQTAGSDHREIEMAVNEAIKVAEAQGALGFAALARAQRMEATAW